MTVITPRLGFERLARRSPFTRVGERLARRAALPRPPAYVVVCASTGVLNIVGLVMILSASSVAALSNYGSSWYFFERQLMWAVIGLAAFVVASRVDYHRWRRTTPYVLVVAVALLLVVLVPNVGIEVDGSRRWLGLGSWRLQPSELAKVALLLYGADMLARRRNRLHDVRMWRPVLVVLGVLCALVVKEPDLDSTVVLALIAFALLLVAGVSRKDIFTMATVGVAAAAILSVAVPYRRARVFAFLHPGSDTSNTGYQIMQSLIALGSGGVNGVGLGAGRAKWLFLPNAHTDFIFAILGEELGFVGEIAVLALFAMLLYAGVRVAARAPDNFGRLLAAGITAWLGLQAIVNLGAVTGLLPVTGVPLPLVSYGGSALVVTLAGIGVLASIARAGAGTRGRRRRAAA